MNVSKLCVVVGACFLTACSATERSIAPDGITPRKELVAIDCQLSPEQCSIIRAGIAYLKDHANPMCRSMGANADDRYWAPTGAGQGFRRQPAHATFSMSVFTTKVGGYTPADGYTNVHANYWNSKFTNPGAAGGLIAHEEVHHLGFSESAAVSMQNQCLNPQS
jgi:hypothetical protein